MREPTEHMTDLLSETAAALAWCVGVLEGTGKHSDVPSWVHNALSHARSPMAATRIREQIARDREAEHRRLIGEKMRLPYSGGGGGSLNR